MVIVGAYEYFNSSRDSEGKPSVERDATEVYCYVVEEYWRSEQGKWFPQQYWFHPVCPCFEDGDKCYCTPVMAFDSVIWG